LNGFISNHTVELLGVGVETLHTNVDLRLVIPMPPDVDNQRGVRYDSQQDD
jgi:hypothetical protein